MMKEEEEELTDQSKTSLDWTGLGCLEEEEEKCAVGLYVLNTLVNYLIAFVSMVVLFFLSFFRLGRLILLYYCTGTS